MLQYSIISWSYGLREKKGTVEKGRKKKRERERWSKNQKN
jgi:hypothetical protein